MPKKCKSGNCQNPVWGGGYCRNHQHSRADKKPKLLGARKKTGELQVFMEIWAERPHFSELSGRPLEQYASTAFFASLFAHILNKGMYPKFRLNKDNIVLLHPEEHNLLDFGTIDQREAYARKYYCDWQEIYDKKEYLKSIYE
jgi:hypothetical protein